MNKKARIDTYSTIYDIDVVVANKEVTIEEIKKQFCYLDDKELNDDSWNWYFISCLVKRKKDGAIVGLVHQGKDNRDFVSSGDETLDLVDVCAHEAVHIALDIYTEVGAKVDPGNQESFAYFVGYIAERIYKTISNK